LKERTTVARPKTRRDPCLQTRPYLHDGKKTWTHRRKSRAVECVGIGIQVVSSHPSA
jgi:hypothetical protein